MVYILGIPTHVAVGTDLFEIIISAGYGTVTHALKGNVDILIALVMHTGAAVGAQIGAALTEYFEGVYIRIAFIPLPLIGAALILYGLFTGHPLFEVRSKPYIRWHALCINKFLRWFHGRKFDDL